VRAGGGRFSTGTVFVYTKRVYIFVKRKINMEMNINQYKPISALWGLVVNHVPALKTEIERLLEK